ncbi:DUF2946 domain-containing protein [Janthinobacterium sp. PC23-8]|uniref:DUF2946 domain-containing protein n=1 Tax=Janthinobacterium sp. PC23-8 TaxID=2012679 RepID=UPI0020CBB39B|nr:DUF2946 domain-containing protein [Janthinobacterium sp. PC23-8]
MKRQTLQIWLAILAVLFAAIAPSISHALAAPAVSVPSSLLMQICTVDGMVDVGVDVGEKKPGVDPVVHAFEHCPYCSTHAGSFALLPGLSPNFAVSGGHDSYPPLYYRAPAPLFLWSSGNPRAPPVLS